MRSDELSSQHLCALSFQRNIHVCGKGIAGLPVAGFLWTTCYAVPSEVLNSIRQPYFHKKRPLANLVTYFNVILLCKICTMFGSIVKNSMMTCHLHVHVLATWILTVVLTVVYTVYYKSIALSIWKLEFKEDLLIQIWVRFNCELR